jgi:hypothetical protein
MRDRRSVRRDLVMFDALCSPMIAASRTLAKPPALWKVENGGRKRNEQHRHDDHPSRLAENEAPTQRRNDGRHNPVLSLPTH